MKNKIIPIIFLLLIATPTAKAEETKNKPIDKNTVILNYKQKDEQFIIKIRSEKNQKLIVYDIMRLFRSGENIKKTFELEKGTNKIKISCSLINGEAAVRLITKKGSIALVTQEKSFYQKPATWKDVVTGAITGATTGFLLPLSFGYYEKKKETNEPEEIL